MAQGSFEIRDSEIDVAGIMAKIRKNIDERKKRGMYSEEEMHQVERLKMKENPQERDYLEHCVRTVAALANVDVEHYRFGIPPFLNRPVLGHIVLRVKGIIRRLLRFHTRGIFSQQIEFNNQIALLLDSLYKKNTELEEKVGRLEQRKL